MVVLAYLANARNCYRRWGAEAKVRHLDDRYPDIRDKSAGPRPTSTVGTPVERLDLATVLRVSGRVSGEITGDKLVEAILRTAVEHAGAERGLLLLPDGPDVKVHAEAMVTGEVIEVGSCDPDAPDMDFPRSLALYVKRIQDTVMLDNASARGPFTGDEYFSRHATRSVICVPLIKQGETVALLYLENNLTPGAFTPSRVAVLKFLASEAATSLDNARLYGELRERESRIRRLVDSNIIGIVFFESDYRIVDANDSFLDLVGYDRNDLAAGRVRWLEMTPPEWLEIVMRVREELRLIVTTQTYMREFIRKDGSRVPVLLGIATFDERHDNGVAFVLDLSERKRAEDEARESERRYTEAQMELVHANRVAVMGQLTASIAHEVNQPNTAVVASAQAALRWLERPTPELEAVRQALVRIERNGIRAGEVIGRIRDLVKKAPPQRDRISMSGVIELTEVEAARNHVVVETAFSENLPQVVGDRVELQQVTLNLILNAIEAMRATPKGARRLLIRTERVDDRVHVSVADTGPGLPSPTPERLFEPFYTTKAGGLGVGLSICRSIIEAHSGRLWATGNPDGGAVFQFTVRTDSD